MTTYETGLSDHNLLYWDSCLPKPPPNYRSITFRPWKALNVEVFRDALLHSPLCDPQAWTLLDVNELAGMYYVLYTNITIILCVQLNVPDDPLIRGTTTIVDLLNDCPGSLNVTKKELKRQTLHLRRMLWRFGDRVCETTEFY